MSSNAEITRRYFGGISQLTNWILDSGATCNIKPEISDLYQDQWWKWINTLELQMGILSQQKNWISSNENV